MLTGDILKTPIDLDYSKTELPDLGYEMARGRDTSGEFPWTKTARPTFLHVLSEDNLKSHRYYYVRREEGEVAADTHMPFQSSME